MFFQVTVHYETPFFGPNPSKRWMLGILFAALFAFLGEREMCVFGGVTNIVVGPGQSPSLVKRGYETRTTTFNIYKDYGRSRLDAELISLSTCSKCGHLQRYHIWPEITISCKSSLGMQGLSLLTPLTTMVPVTRTILSFHLFYIIAILS